MKILELNKTLNSTCFVVFTKIHCWIEFSEYGARLVVPARFEFNTKALLAEADKLGFGFRIKEWVHGEGTRTTLTALMEMI